MAKVNPMPNYLFPPAVSKGRQPSLVWWEDAFTDEDIEQMKKQLKALASTPAVIENQTGPAPEQIRSSKVSWLDYSPETSWIYERMAYVASQLNAEYYNFDLYGFCEDMQFTIYDETDAHYTWHIDMGDHSRAPRKLSMVMQLSDPSDYEGGELQVLDKAEPEIIKKKKGLITVFPAYTLHRVTPVTKGVRYSLVVWICGPMFK